jgi:prevent-host-death family protein
MEITASAFKAQCLRLLDQVSQTGEELVILKRGRPVARVVAARDSKPWLALRGRGELCGDPFDPVGIDGDLRTGESTFF